MFRKTIILKEGRNTLIEIKKIEDNDKNSIYGSRTKNQLNYNILNNYNNAGYYIKKANYLNNIYLLANSHFKGSFYIIPKIIGKLGNRNIDLLIKIAFNRENDLSVRRYVIEGLGKIGDKRICRKLHLLLKNENIFIKKSIIAALADLGDKDSVDILLNLLECEDDWIKHNIIWALGVIGDPKCLNKLIEMFTSENLNFLIRKNIVTALGKLGSKKAVNLLIKILNDPHSGLEEYAVLALDKIEDEKAIIPLIKNLLNPIWFLKNDYKILINKLSPNLKSMLKEYDCTYYIREQLPAQFLINYKESIEWHYGYLNKSHYYLNSLNKIIGCLNIIFLSIYENTYLFYWDTIEIKEKYRRLRLGSKFCKYMIKSIINQYKKFYIFLLVAKCEQYKLKFFSSLGFSPVKLRKTEVGTHCIMCYPFDENSEKYCLRLFEYFNWREEKREVISSDCKYAYNSNPTGLYWCTKKNIYVTGLEKKSCSNYIKDKELFNEKKFLDLRGFLN
ncbi:MAG: HEAT repeat domain-containing protein [Promethearchaeota archaeon]